LPAASGAENTAPPRSAVNSTEGLTYKEAARILPSWKSQATCLVCWTTQAPVGEVVQPAMWTRRLPTSVKNSGKSRVRIGRQALGFEAPAPCGLRDDVLQLILSLPVIGYSAWIFFDGLVRALRQRTLDMMVLVAVAIGAGWLYLLVVTLRGDGDVFYEAATVLATFVLLGHWFEMRARGGANDAIRTLLDLAPPRAFVLGDGEPVEVPTSEVAVGDLLLIRPGARVPVDAVVEEGEGEVDESMVTGESMLMSNSAGSELIGATINRSGTLRTRAAKVGADTALGRSRSWSRSAELEGAGHQ
jgi:cation transport ATPase